MATRLFVFVSVVFALNSVVACDTYITEETQPGPKGDPGKSGIDGEDGESCTVIDNGDGTADLVCPDGTVWTFGDEEGGDSCEPYLNYPKQGEYVTSHVDGEPVAPLGVMLIPDGHTTISAVLEVFVEDGCGSGAVINHIDVTVENLPEISDLHSAPPLFVVRVNDSASGIHEALALPGEPQSLVATLTIGKPVAPARSAYLGVVLENLPSMTAAQASDIVLGINITFTDVDTSNQYMMGGWQFRQ